MKQVYRFDENGFYKEPVIIDDNGIIPSNCTEIKPQDGLYKGKFVEGQWIETLTQEEINQLNIV